MDRFGYGAWTPEGCDTNDEASLSDPAVRFTTSRASKVNQHTSLPAPTMVSKIRYARKK